MPTQDIFECNSCGHRWEMLVEQVYVSPWQEGDDGSSRISCDRCWIHYLLPPSIEGSCWQEWYETFVSKGGSGNASTDAYVEQLNSEFAGRPHDIRMPFPSVVAHCPRCTKDMRKKVEFAICPNCEQATGDRIGTAFISIVTMPEEILAPPAAASAIAPRTKCRQCETPMSQRTADKNDGYCARCIIDIRNPRPPEPPLLPLSLEDLKHRISTQSQDRVNNAVFNRSAMKKFEDFSEGDVIAYTVLTLHGETLNGGIRQYFDNPSGYMAHRCGASLRRIGATKYAEVVENCIKAFTSAPDRNDPQWGKDQDAFEAGKKDPFAELEKPLWDLLEDEDELPRLLYQFIVQNPELFVAAQSE